MSQAEYYWVVFDNSTEIGVETVTYRRLREYGIQGIVEIGSIQRPRSELIFRKFGDLIVNVKHLSKNIRLLKLKGSNNLFRLCMTCGERALVLIGPTTEDCLSQTTAALEKVQRLSLRAESNAWEASRAEEKIKNASIWLRKIKEEIPHLADDLNAAIAKLSEPQACQQFVPGDSIEEAKTRLREAVIVAADQLSYLKVRGIAEKPHKKAEWVRRLERKYLDQGLQMEENTL